MAFLGSAYSQNAKPKKIGDLKTYHEENSIGISQKEVLASINKNDSKDNSLHHEFVELKSSGNHFKDKHNNMMLKFAGNSKDVFSVGLITTPKSYKNRETQKAFVRCVKRISVTIDKDLADKASEFVRKHAADVTDEKIKSPKAFKWKKLHVGIHRHVYPDDVVTLEFLIRLN